jgi:hypothetical protein
LCAQSESEQGEGERGAIHKSCKVSQRSLECQGAGRSS